MLIVHGDQDIYFPPDHGQQLYDAAREPKELWLIPGFGHAERHTDDALVDRIAAWADKASAVPGRGHAGGRAARQLAAGGGSPRLRAPRGGRSAHQLVGTGMPSV